VTTEYLDRPVAYISLSEKISKKLVNSDFKRNRVVDPTKITSKQEKQVKIYVKDYFDKAVSKHEEREKKRVERKASKAGSGGASTAVKETDTRRMADDSDGDQNMATSDDDEDEKPSLKSTTPMSPADMVLGSDGLKRKRIYDDGRQPVNMDDTMPTPNKRLKSETPPPPPPPPAPTNGIYPANDVAEPDRDVSMSPDMISSGVQTGGIFPGDSALNGVEPLLSPQAPPPPADVVSEPGHGVRVLGTMSPEDARSAMSDDPDPADVDSESILDGKNRSRFHAVQT